METPEFKLFVELKWGYYMKENPFITAVPLGSCRASLNRNRLHERDLPTLIKQFGISHRDGAVGHDHFSLSHLYYGAFFQLSIENFSIRKLFIIANLFHCWIDDRFVVSFLQYFVNWTLIAGISTGIALPLMFHIILNSPLCISAERWWVGTLTTSIAPAISL